MNPIGTCVLCRSTNVTLINSHIVSRWAYRRLIAYDTGGGNVPVAVDEGRAGFSPKQATEYLLCQACEALLSVREGYVAQHCLQPDSATFPLLQGATVVPSTGLRQVVDVSAFDTDKVTHFGLSVFWRADLGHTDPIVSLEAWREPIREYLLGGPLPDEVDLVVELIQPPKGYPRVDRVMGFPASAPDGTTHDFLAAGMRFLMFTRHATPPPTAALSLPRAKRAIVTDGRDLLNAVAEKVQTSTAYGKLAQKH